MPQLNICGKCSIVNIPLPSPFEKAMYVIIKHMCHTCVLAGLQIPAANDQLWKENHATLAKKTSMVGPLHADKVDQAAVSSKVFL